VASGALDSEIDRIRRAFDMPAGMAHLLIVLSRAQRPLNHYELADAIGSKSGGVVSVYISRLRKAFGYDQIETLPRRGFQLSPEGQERVRKVLA
jgi:DNA-binding winged helix-turn-helix (wHTH) protein